MQIHVCLYFDMVYALLKRECYSNTSGVLTVSVKNPSVTVTLGRCYGYTG